MTLTLLAGLSALPKDPYESAKIDGANPIQIFFHITLTNDGPSLIGCGLHPLDGFTKGS